MKTKFLRPVFVNEKNNKIISVIDQRALPHKLDILNLKKVDDIIFAIKEMVVRGAPLIGVVGAFGVYLAALNSKNLTSFKKECEKIKEARPTAVNLAWAVDKSLKEVLKEKDHKKQIDISLKMAFDILDFEVFSSKKIGEFGAKIIKEISLKKKGGPVNILTHCNAGYLATIEYGTATAPMYVANEEGIDIHIWVDETRPLNQGSRLTAWELSQNGIKHTIIADNTGGHLMQHKMVDMVIVGTDRTTYTGDVANKIGTYLKALAAKDNNIPFYVALPSSTFDWKIKDGIKEIPIETRNEDEVRFISGLSGKTIKKVLLCPKESPALNYAFDVTPARLITGFITEKGICKANEKDIKKLFKDKNE